MVKTIYVDVLFIINFIINYLILFACFHIHTIYVKRWRLFLAATLSALYGVFAFFPEFSFLTSFLMKTLSCFCISFIAFGKYRILRNTLSFLAISLAFGGVVFAATLLDTSGTFEVENGIYYIHISLPVLLASTALAYFILSLVFYRRGKAENCEIKEIVISNEGRSVKLRALRDTGNSLRAPHTNAPVVICDYPAVRELFPSDAKTLLDGEAPKNYPLLLDKLSQHGEFGLLPYKAVGVSFSLLLSFKPDKITRDKETIHGALIAFSDSTISDGGAYSAII